VRLMRHWRVLCALLLVLSCETPAFAFDGIRVTLLGTGALVPSIERFGPAILVEAGNSVLLFDCGRGAAQRLGQAGVALKDIDAVLFTHLHSDHLVGLPDVWLTGLALGRKEPLTMIGPDGTQAMARHLEQAFAADIAGRGIAQEPAALDAHDIGENVVFQTEDVVVSAFVVDHGAIKPAYGYRVDYRGQRSVVLSGDTRYSEELIEHAKGVQLLVHEVAAANPELVRTKPALRGILDIHTTPEDAARVFRAARPYLAIYSHVILLGVSEDDVLRATHEAYRGAVQMGKDLMVIEIQNEVQVRSGPSEPRTSKEQ
jgi:ribonuclease Z